MSKGLLFWVIMVVWLIFGLYVSWPAPKTVGNTLILFILLAILGWQVFGPPVK